MNKQNLFKSQLSILLLGVVIGIFASIGFSYLSKNFNISGEKPCTLEARVCPDGSTVGRVGPNCEFTPCPILKPTLSTDETVSWKTYINKKFNYVIKYPSELTIGNDIDPESAFEYVDNLYLIDNMGNFIDIFNEKNPNKLAVNDWLKSDRGQIYNFNNSNYRKINISLLDWYIFDPPLTFSLDSSAFKWGLFYNTEIFLVGNKTRLSDITLETILSTLKFLDQNQTKQACGGWDPSGEIICECTGKLTKSTCPIGAVCDSGTYFCDGECGQCCYKGISARDDYPKCN